MKRKDNNDTRPRDAKDNRNEKTGGRSENQSGQNVSDEKPGRTSNQGRKQSSGGQTRGSGKKD